VRRVRGAIWQGEPLSSEEASYGEGADKVLASQAVKVPAKKSGVVWCKQIQLVGRGREEARQRPRSTNTNDGDRVTIF